MCYNLGDSITVTEFESLHLYYNLDDSILLHISGNPEAILMILDSLESSRCDDSNEWLYKRKSLILTLEITRNLSISITNWMLALVSEWYCQHLCYNLAVSISITEFESEYLYCNVDVSILLQISTNPEPNLMILDSLESSRCDDSNEW